MHTPIAIPLPPQTLQHQHNHNRQTECYAQTLVVGVNGKSEYVGEAEEGDLQRDEPGRLWDGHLDF
ncbi:hypothetical protein J1614_004458 [Plenodomus biglobosus]|nr:hypothetical protein J1614_004458 [Plenodomus biglobosus]